MTVRNDLKTGRLRPRISALPPKKLRLPRGCHKAIEKPQCNPCNSKKLEQGGADLCDAARR